MRISKQWLFASSIALVVGAGSIAHAESEIMEWNPRSLEQVEADLIYSEDNQVKYVIQYGDTLSVISEAMNIDADYLAEINDIYSIDLIYPETVLSAQYDDFDRAHSLTVETTEGEAIESSIPVNLSNFTEATWLEEEVVEEVAQVDLPVVEVRSNHDTAEAVAVESNETLVYAAENEGEVAVIEYEDEASDTIMTEEIPLDNPKDVLENVVENELKEIVETEQGEPELPPVPTEKIETELAEEKPSEMIVEEVVEEVIEDYNLPPKEELVETTPVEEELVETYPVEETEDVNEAIYLEEEVPAEPVSDNPYLADPMANPQNAGLKPHVAEYKERVGDMYDVDQYSLYRPGDTSGDHGQGLAVDFMVYDDANKGNEIAQYSVDQMKSGQDNIEYVIWQQQINGSWTNYNWQLMEDRGSVTANHYDHVHVSFN